MSLRDNYLENRRLFAKRDRQMIDYLTLGRYFRYIIMTASDCGTGYVVGRKVVLRYFFISFPPQLLTIWCHYVDLFLGYPPYL